MYQSLYKKKREILKNEETVQFNSQWTSIY